MGNGIECASCGFKNQVQVNEPIQLTIEADDALNNDELQFDVLAKDFNYSGPSRSSGTSIINGNISRYTTWRLNIAPKRTGTITIPSFDVGERKPHPFRSRSPNPPAIPPPILKR